MTFLSKSSRRVFEADEAKSETKIYMEGWPNDYKILTGRIYDGISTEYPRTFKPYGRKELFLVPSSIYCGLSREKLSKAQRSKMCTHTCPEIGMAVTAVVRIGGGGGQEKDNVVKDIIPEMKFRHADIDGNWYKVDLVISPDSPTICHTPMFENVLVPSIVSGLTMDSIIPNVVYVGYIDPKIVITNNKGVESGANTEAVIQPELVKISYVKPLEKDEDFDNSNSNDIILRGCPWNYSRPATGRRLSSDFSDEVLNHSGPQNTSIIANVAPKPPTRKMKRIVLWYFEGNIVIRANVPRTQVKITQGMEKIIPVHAKHLELRDGECLFGTIVFNEYIDCYYVEKYVMLTNVKRQFNRTPKQRKLVTRLSPKVGDLDFFNEYLVNVHASTEFKGFYTCTPLRACLIADPNGVLRNVSMEMHEAKGCPVWIRLEKNHDRLAHFTISALDRASGEYSPKEKMMDYPNITGCGLLISPEIGAVFSQQHPQKDIRIGTLDKVTIRMGHFFYFNAAFWPEKNFYLIGNLQPISTSFMEPIRTFFCDRRLMFEEKFKCYCLHAAETHVGKTFGPISDPMLLVTATTKLAKVDWPERGHGFVGHNPDWIPGQDSQIILHGFEMDKNAKQVTSLIIQYDPVEDEEKRCDCYELWHLLHDIRVKTQGILNEEKWQEVEKLEKKIQPMILRKMQ